MTHEQRSALEQSQAGPYAVAAEHADDPAVANQLAEQVYILTGRHV